MPAPVASGWSGCRVGLAPTGKRRLSRRTWKADIRFAYLNDEFAPGGTEAEVAIPRDFFDNISSG